MYRRLSSSITLVLSLLLATATLQAERVYNLRSYGITPGDTLRGEELAQLMSRLSGQHGGEGITFTFEPGVYHLRAEGSPRRQLFISNHDQLMEPRPIGLLLEEVDHVTIDGMGSLLLCEDSMLPIAILGSKRVTVRNLRVDYRTPGITQATVVNNKGEGGITLAPAPWVQWRINDDGYFESYGTNWRTTLGAGIAFEPTTRNTHYRVSDLGYSTAEATRVGSGHVHIPKWHDARLLAGTVVAMRSYLRPHPGIFVDASTDTSFDRVTVHYADGMGILAQNSRNLTLRAFDVRPSGDRYFSTQADATHFSGCSGHIEVSDGHYEAMMDDAINVHGVYLRLIKRIDSRTVTGRYMHGQAWGMEWGMRGDTVQFVESRTFDVVKQKNVIRSIMPCDKETVAGAKEFVISFENPLPQTVNETIGIGIENLSKTPSVTFSHNRISRNRARGTLFNTPKLVLVEGNHFDHISGSGILVSSDCNMWFESGRTRHLIVRGNLFEDVLTSLYQFTEAVISINPVIPELNEQRRPFYGDGEAGITIEDNIFKTFDTPLLYAQSVDGLLWRRNIVIETKTYPKYHHNQKPYILVGSQNIQIED